jgi:hypothetical protein
LYIRFGVQRILEEILQPQCKSIAMAFIGYVPLGVSKDNVGADAKLFVIPIATESE